MTPSAERTLTFPALDTLRFVGALGVVVTHVAFQTGQYGPGVSGTFFARLDSGVALFFVLSGFLLSRPFLSRMARGADLPYVGFYLWKRSLRILPVYLICTVLVLALIPPSRGPFWPRWVENLTLTTIYTPGQLPQGLTQMWSLATEVAFYLVLPLLMVALARSVCRHRWHPVGLLGVLAGLCATNVIWLSLVQLDDDLALWLPAFLTWFSAGIAIAVVSVDLTRSTPHRWAVFTARLGTTPAACLVAAGAVLLIASTPLAGPIVADVPTAGEAIVKNLLYTAFAFLLVATGVFGRSDARVMQILSWAPLRYLGRISYGVFCIHLLVLYATFSWLDLAYFSGHFMMILAITIVSSVALAAALHAWVEVPTERLRRFGQPKTEAATTPNATAIIT